VRIPEIGENLNSNGVFEGRWSRAGSRHQAFLISTVPSKLAGTRNRVGSRYRKFLITTMPSKLAELGYTNETHVGATQFFQPTHPSL